LHELLYGKWLLVLEGAKHQLPLLGYALSVLPQSSPKLLKRLHVAIIHDFATNLQLIQWLGTLKIMIAILLATGTFFSTLLGGLTALKNHDRLHRLLGLTAGVVIGVVTFDLLPEIFKSIGHGISAREAMIALVCGFLLFHIVEKSILIHHSQEREYEVHHHPQVGFASALALSGHSFLDGLGIGLGFQAGNAVGIAVAIAVIAHDFSDGLNTVMLMLVNRNKRRKAFAMLMVDALAPVAGAIVGTIVHISDRGLTIYLAFFAGFLLYIGASEILPEAHSKHSSYATILLTIAGVVFMFFVTRFA
jgi:zinc transporter ZupT